VKILKYMKSKTVQRLFDKMKKAPLDVKIKRWFTFKLFELMFITRKYWDKIPKENKNG
jgi:hypothetical protein